jgi:hypothetical protein
MPVAPAFALDPIPTVPNANVFGESIEGPRVDASSGAYTEKLALDIPPGRNNLQPDLSLQYNSQNTSDSEVGYGWSLSIPYIQRLNKTGSQDLYATSSYFTSSIEGELAIDGGITTSAPVTSFSTSPTILDTRYLTHSTASFSQRNI